MCTESACAKGGGRVAYPLPFRISAQGNSETGTPLWHAGSEEALLLQSFPAGALLCIPASRRRLPSPAGSAAARAGRRMQVLQNVEAFAKALIMHDLSFPQEEQRLNDLLVVGHVHQVLIGRSRLLLWYDHVRTTFHQKFQ